jgi:integrase/recombinase XerD
MLVAYYHGLRISEVLGILPQDIQDGKLIIKRGKDSRTTTQSLVHHIDPLMDECGQLSRLPLQHTRLFPYHRSHAWKIFHAAVLAAGLPITAAHPHVCKHSCAMTMLENGAALNDVQARLGHKSITSTARYLHANDRTADHAALKAFGGLS